uniref:Uncharacterized protein n=1 Tax=mine drainage metagenome TaxID=410659 RepID=E6PQ01_9ZZZZ
MSEVVVIAVLHYQSGGAALRSVERFEHLADVPQQWAQHITATNNPQVIYAERVCIVYTPRTHQPFFNPQE